MYYSILKQTCSRPSTDYLAFAMSQIPDSGPAKISIRVTAEREADSVNTMGGDQNDYNKRDYSDTV